MPVYQLNTYVYGPASPFFSPFLQKFTCQTWASLFQIQVSSLRQLKSHSSQVFIIETLSPESTAAAANPKKLCDVFLTASEFLSGYSQSPSCPLRHQNKQSHHNCISDVCLGFGKYSQCVVFPTLCCVTEQQLWIKSPYIGANNKAWLSKEGARNVL